jgi:protein tyrosine/serine phosphatase
MEASISKSLTCRRLFPRIVLTILTLVILSVMPATFAQSGREKVEGVKNFGRVTDRYFRGGAVTPDGISTLAKMGVRTIIDLRDNPNADEPAVSRRNGIKYFNFPMTGHDTPDDKAINEILSIIQKAKDPVYVHCSAGKHRAGTIAALYRMRIQGWSKDRAWAEQRSYGFGTPEEHPKLYAYVYGSRAELVGLSARTSADDKDRDKSSSKGKKKKEDKLAKARKDDDDDDDDRDDDAKKERRDKKDRKKDKARTTAIADSKADDNVKGEPAAIAAPSQARASAGLSSETGYITVAEAIKRAKAEGGSGAVLKVDLEWDPARSVATWDVTFSSGSEYEIEATTGKLLGTKPKEPAKLAVLSPLELERNRLLTFQEIIRKAETSRSQTVMEMELKRIKGRSETIYEVVLADGATLLYDAATGDAINGI